MKPIGQTFYVNGPSTGVPGIYITKVDVFFKSVSSAYGIELQIRTTENGVPTTQRLPFASKIISPSDVVPPVASENASVATTFEFETPVFVQTGSSYALVLLPVGGNPHYQVWTAEIGQKDVVTSQPIYTNNDTGDLFLSSNDRDWIPVITEDWKFKVYYAEFTATSGTAVFNSPDEDYIELEDTIGSLYLGEPLYPTNNAIDANYLFVSGVTGSFSNGNYVYQANATANVCFGYVYAANSTAIRIANVTGSWSSSYTINNANVSGNAVVVAVLKTANVVSGSNTFYVPDSSLFSTNDVIYIATNTFSQAQIVKVTAKPDSTSLSFTNAFLNSTTTSLFTDTNCIYGKVLFNGTLVGGLGSLRVFPDFTRIILDSVTSTTSNNFTSAVGQRLIGMFSGASGKVHDVIDVPYNQIGPQFTHITPANTEIGWNVQGVRNNAAYTVDPASIPIAEGTANELRDYERIIMSRSNELSELPIGRIGDRSVTIAADLTTSNSSVSPAIDTLSKYAHFTKNLCVPDYELFGYYLDIANTNGTFANGDIVQQGGSSAVVRFANSTFVRITDVSNGSFTANSTQITSASANALISTAEHYNECFDNGLFLSSRYISKNVILASGQESEDMIAFLAAFRPPTTNFRVYAKLRNAQDSDNYEDKHWTYLPERSGTYSSQVNKNDIVEITYGLTQSVNLTPRTNSCNTSSKVVSITAPYTTEDMYKGCVIYLSDNASQSFNVRVVDEITNSSSIVVNKIPSFTSSNLAIGLIPNMISPYGAFLNDQNNNIVRYSTADDLIYDTYSQFSIKIVPVSVTTALVPTAADMRVLAIQS